jgi:DNA repair exonuclease SbcCD ATPase subunit
MPWPPYLPVAKQLKRHNDELARQLLRVREQLRDKEYRCSGLEMILRERLRRVDELTAKLEQARAANHRLEEECEHLAQLVAGPQLNTVPE